MKSLKVDFPEGDTKKLRRAISSAKDVLCGVPDYNEEQPEVAIKVIFSGRVEVNRGSRLSLPAGEYLASNIGYKYIQITNNSKVFEVKAEKASQVKVLYKNGDKKDE